MLCPSQWTTMVCLIVLHQMVRPGEHNVCTLCEKTLVPVFPYLQNIRSRTLKDRLLNWTLLGGIEKSLEQSSGYFWKTLFETRRPIYSSQKGLGRLMTSLLCYYYFFEVTSCLVLVLCKIFPRNCQVEHFWQKCISLPSVRGPGLQRTPGRQFCSGYQANCRLQSLIYLFARFWESVISE